MSATRWILNVLEPSAAGRAAFWIGRPIWANPLTGADAREWRTGWNIGLAEFSTFTGFPTLPAKALLRRQLLTRHRPGDVLLTVTHAAGAARLRHRRANV